MILFLLRYYCNDLTNKVVEENSSRSFGTKREREKKGTWNGYIIYAAVIKFLILWFSYVSGSGSIEKCCRNDTFGCCP